MLPPSPQPSVAGLDPLTMPMAGFGPPTAEPKAPTPLGGPGAIAEPKLPSPQVATTRLLHQQRLASVLRGIVEGLDLSGAEFWLLDDATAELRPAADYGDHAPGPARPLETAQADVAAMAGSAIVLEDAEQVAEWQVDRPCRAAVCVPVASDATIHGTLWLYCVTPRAFTDGELQLIEITAGRLAVEVERRRMLDAGATTPTLPPATLPQPAPTQLGELEIAGDATVDADSIALHDWLTLADGRLLLLAGAVVDTPGGTRTDALLAAQAARIAARSFAEADTTAPLDAGQLLSRISQTVWQATPGGEGLSLAVALVDPEELTGTYALAGGAVAMSVRASSTWVESTEAPPAGWDQTERYATHPFELKLRERLVFPVVDPRNATPTKVDHLADPYRGLPAETHRRMTAERTVELLKESPSNPQAAVALRWC